MEEFEPKKRNKIVTKEFMAKYAYVFVLAILLVGGITYGYTFFKENKKVASGSITTAALTINMSNGDISATNLSVPQDNQEGLSEFSKSLTITNTTATDGIVTLNLTRTSGLNLTDMSYAIVVNGAIQEIGDVPANGEILSTAVMGNETINIELRLWPKTTYTGSATTFVGEITPEIKYLGAKATTSISSPAGKYVEFNCNGSTCEKWQIVKVEDDRLVLTRQADYTNATSRTNSNKYNTSLTFNDNSLITSVSTDGKNVYLAKTVKITGGDGTIDNPYKLTNNIFYEKDKKVIAVITYKDGTTTIGTQNVYYNETNYISQVLNDPAFQYWDDGTNHYNLGDTINFTSDTILTATIELSLLDSIVSKASSVNYIASYDDIIDAHPTFTTQDQVSTSAPKQTVYYFTGADAAANANVIFAGYCWQIIRTTDNGGVRMIYNGVAQKGITLTTEPINDTDIAYTNDATYPYTYDSSTKKWTSTNHTDSATGTFIFTVKEAGDYAINYTISSEDNYDKARFYKNNTLIKEDSGTNEGSVELGTLVTTDEIKVEYTKDSSGSSGNDNVIFEIARVTNRVESENLECQPNRMATKGINGQNGTTQSMSVAILYGRSYDYDLDTGEFTIEDSTGLPSTWTTNDANSNGTEDYKELIGTYTCLSSSSTCSTLYYVGSINQSNIAQAYVAKYTIGDVAHFSELGTSAFNPNYYSLALVGYMFNNEYDRKSESKSGEYYTNAVWENGAYVLSNSNNGTTPDVEHHYICDDNDCTRVRYYYYVSGSSHYYILLENGKTVEGALKEMINHKTNANEIDEHINVYNSAIKGYLDNWYKKNLIAYTSYLDGTSVYCNDRSIRELGGWNPTAAPSLTTYLQFYQYSANRDLNCVNETDRFAVANNKAKLTYPIGLLTEPERNLMTYNYAATGQYYWGASPNRFTGNGASVRNVYTTGSNNSNYVDDSLGARGVVSLRPGIDFESGTGTYTDPYVVGPLVTRTN